MKKISLLKMMVYLIQYLLVFHQISNFISRNKNTIDNIKDVSKTVGSVASATNKIKEAVNQAQKLDEIKH